MRRAYVLTVAHCWHKLFEHKTQTLLERSNTSRQKLLAQTVLTPLLDVLTPLLDLPAADFGCPSSQKALFASFLAVLRAF